MDGYYAYWSSWRSWRIPCTAGQSFTSPHQILISSMLLRRHPTDNKALFLSRPSYIRSQVNDLLKQFPPLPIDLPRFSNSLDDPTVSSEHHNSVPSTATRPSWYTTRYDYLDYLYMSRSANIYSYASSRPFFLIPITNAQTWTFFFFNVHELTPC